MSLASELIEEREREIARLRKHEARLRFLVEKRAHVESYTYSDGTVSWGVVWPELRGDHVEPAEYDTWEEAIDAARDKEDPFA